MGKVKSKEFLAKSNHNIKGCRIKCMSKKCKFNIDELCLNKFVWVTREQKCKSFKEKNKNV